MTPLRERYVQDLRLRNKSPRTIETYVLRVALFARHFGCSPERLGPEHLRTYQEHLIARNVSWSTFNQAVCALRFLYQVTLGRPEAIRHLPFAKRPRIVPVVLSPEEVVRFLEAALPGRDRMLLDVIYSCGLRLKEALGLQVADIDSGRMVLRIRHGKGQKERLVPLSPRLLTALREYWREHRPATWLFPGIKATVPMPAPFALSFPGCVGNARLCRLRQGTRDCPNSGMAAFLFVFFCRIFRFLKDFGDRSP